MKKFLLSILIVLMVAFGASAEFFSDIIVTSPNGLWTDERAYASLADAITAVGANERTIIVASEEVVTNLTIPANVTLKFQRGGSITNSGTLNFDTTNIIADAVQIFTGTGNVDFENGTIVKTSWFSDFVEAVDQTNNDYTTLLITEKGYVDADCALGDNVVLKSESYGNRIVANAGFTLSNIKNIECPNFQLFAGSGDFDFLDGTRLKLSWFNRLRSVLTWVENEKVTIVVDGTHTVDYTQAATGNENFDFKSEQGQFSVSAGVTLTINSPADIIAQPDQQIFTGDGDISFSVAGTIHVGWRSMDGTEDATEIQKIVNSAPAGSVIEFLPGKTYQMNVSAIALEDHYNSYAGGWTYDSHVAVEYGVSNLTIRGEGSILQIHDATTGGGTKINFIFGNNSSNAVDDITFDGLHFDMDSDNNDNERAILAVSVERLTVKNCKIYSSNTKGGIGVDLFNCVDPIIINNKFYNLNNGIAAIYTYGVEVVGNLFETVSEAVDLDKLCSRVSITGNAFVNTGSSDKALDFNSSSHITVSGNSFSGGSQGVLTFNGKANVASTWADWLTQTDLAYTRGAYLVFSGNDVFNCAYVAGRSLIAIGDYWVSSPHGTGDDASDPVGDIAFIGNVFKQVGYVNIKEGLNISFTGDIFNDVITADMSRGAAIKAWSEEDEVTYPGSDTYSDLEISLSNVVIDTVTRSAIDIDYASQVKIVGCTIKNANTGDNNENEISVYHLNERNCELIFENNLLEGGTTAYRGLYVNSTGGTPSVKYGLNNLILNMSDVAVKLAGDINEYIEGPSQIAYFGTVGAGTDDERPIFIAPSNCYVLDVELVNASDITQHDANYSTYNVRDRGSDGGGTTTIASITTKITGGADLNAFDPVSIGFSVSEVNGYLTKDDVLSLYKADTGAGQASDEMKTIIKYLPY